MPITAGYADPRTDTLYIAGDGNIYRFGEGAALTSVWTSKVYRLPTPSNLARAAVDAEVYPLVLRVYADGALVFTKSVLNRNSFTLPSGFEAQDWQVQIECSGKVTRVRLASSMAELVAAV